MARKATQTYGEPEPYGLIDWARAHRVGLGPLYLALPTLLYGITCNIAASFMVLLIGTITIAMGSGAWIVSRLPEGSWRRKYWTVNVAAVIAWSIWATLASTGEDWMWALLGLASGSVILGIPHWMDKVKRTQVNAEGMLRDWPVRGARIGLGDTKIIQMTYTAVGWTAKLVWTPGTQSVKKVEKIEDDIEGALGLDHGTLKVERDRKSSNSVILNVTLKDPHAKGIMWTIPVEDDDQTRVKTLHGADPFKIGVRADGLEKMLRLFVPGWGARMLLIAGTKGSGKSGLLNLIWTIMSLCDDVVQWGIDLKGGAELGPWRGVFDWIVDTREGALEMLKAAEELVERRGQLLKQYGWKTWQGSPEHPWVVMSIDEAASLLGNASAKQLARLEEVARKGRAVGVCLILATQYPTLDALGTTQIREQIDQRFCFRMQGAGEEYVITIGAPVNAEEIDAERPGTCYHQDGNKVDRIPMRIIFVGDGSNGTSNTVGVIADLMRGNTPELDEASVQNGIEMLEAYANREDTEMRDSDRDGRDADRDDLVSERDGEAETGETVVRDEQPIPEWTENGDVSLDEITRLADADLTQEERDARAASLEASRLADEMEEQNRLGDDEARAALWETLINAGAAGVELETLMAACTRKKTWVYDRCSELAEDGKVRRTQAGTWASLDALINAQ